MKTTVCFDRMPSPLGTILLVAVDDALAGIHFDGQRYLPAIGADWWDGAKHPALRAANEQLAEYFAGGRTAFDLPLAAVGTPFQRAVWEAIRTARYGETITYGELAARVGAPRSIRAAGAATGRNPWAIVVPCHRIIGADGSLTGYAGGLERKRALLDREASRAPLARAA
jgi:methylated-DNA-[protein]-cysteine S-methyltransferase